MNERTCFWFLGGVIFIMASTSLFICQIPVRVTQRPRYSVSFFPKNELSVFHLSLFALRFFSTSSNLFNGSDQSLLVITKNLLMYSGINSNLWKIPFIFSLKISGELLTPIGRRLYRKFLHGRIIVHMLLAY